MGHPVRLPVWLGVTLALSLSGSAATAGTSPHPYGEIAARNAFGLRPLRTEISPPPVPLAKVKLVGITTLADRCALLKVYLRAQPPEPAKVLSCILRVGQRAGPIQLLDIDAATGSVKLDNAGTVMTVTFERESAPPESPPLPLEFLPTPTPVQPVLRGPGR